MHGSGVKDSTSSWGRSSVESLEYPHMDTAHRVSRRRRADIRSALFKPDTELKACTQSSRDLGSGE